MVTGGVRSGKSKHTEGLFDDAAVISYLAPGRPADGQDPEWDARVARHRSRRPAHWVTVETAALDDACRAASGSVLIDCLRTWLTAAMDTGQLWEATTEEAYAAMSLRIDSLCHALADRPVAVVVTNEVGLGVVPSHRSGVMFRDLLGTVNQRVAAVCDEVHLVIAGRVLKL